MISKFNFTLTLYNLILIGYFFSFGNYNRGGAILLLVVFIVWVYYLLKPETIDPIFRLNGNSYSLFSIILSLSLFIQNLIPTLQEPGILERPSNFGTAIHAMAIVVFLSTIFSFFFISSKKITYFYILLVLALLLRLTVIYVSPNPRIDLFDIIRISSSEILKFKNPYELTFIPIYKNVIPNYFPYGPGILFFSVPFVLLLSDQRYLFAVCEVFVAFLIFKIIEKQNRSVLNREIIPLLALFNPVSLFMVLRGWIDPSIVLLYAAATYYLTSSKAYKKTAFIMLGASITIKQSLIFGPIFFLNWLGKKNFHHIIYSYLFAIAVYLPFIAWNAKSFYEDTILWHINYPVRYDALTFNSLWHDLFLNNVPGSIFFLLWTFSLLLIFKSKDKSVEDILMYISFFYFVFFFFNKIAFVNYYYFVSFILLLSLSVSSLKRSNKPRQNSITNS